MKKDIIQAVACFCVMLACAVMKAHAAANGEAEWARIFFAVGIVSSMKMGWHAAAAVDAARGPRRPRRRTADEWRRVIESMHKKEGNK